MIIGEVETRLIVYLSKTVEGKKHDKKLADEEAIDYPDGVTIQQDTGFQGFAPAGVRRSSFSGHETLAAPYFICQL